MASSDFTYEKDWKEPSSVLKEQHLEDGFIGKLQSLKYEYRPDIRDRASLEKNFREKFEALNRVNLTDSEFARLMEEIITPDVFTAAKTLRAITSFVRDDGTPMNYTLVNIKDWCKNTFEVINQLRINTDNSHHRYDAIILINGVPCIQIELKMLGITPRRAMEQIVEYKNDPGNGYLWSTTGSGKTLTSFKASTLLKDNPDIEKCLFVVDRKDLDRQTREEFNKFQEGCVEENTNTATLVRRLLSESMADKVIVTTIQKLGIALDGTNKKNYKQQLFPREDETLPRLRFPEFQAAPEWEEFQLSKFIRSLDAGVSVNAGDRPAKKSEAGVLKTSAVTRAAFGPEENKVVLTEGEKRRLKEPVTAGTIIICRKNTPAIVGSSLYVEMSYKNLFLPALLWAAKPKEGMSMRFLAFILGSEKGRAALSKLARGSSKSMSNITKPDVLALSVMAPTPDEQQRIATCLTSLNDLITAQSAKLEALKTHKKGLMQQLFPSPEEVE